MPKHDTGWNFYGLFFKVAHPSFKSSLTSKYLKFHFRQLDKSRGNKLFFTRFSAILWQFFAISPQNPDKTLLSFFYWNWISTNNRPNELGNPFTHANICHSFPLFSRQTEKAKLRENHTNKANQGLDTEEWILTELTKLSKKWGRTCSLFFRLLFAMRTVVIATTTVLIAAATVLITHYDRPNPLLPGT